MKKTIWIVIVIVIIAVIIGVSKDSGVITDNEPIRIGFIGPLTGDAAIYGETEKNAITLALEKIKKEEYFADRQIDIIYEDGKCAGKEAATAAQKLINVDKVKFIFGGICSGETLGAAPLAETSGVILFASFSSAPAISDAGDFIFRNSPSDIDAAKLDAEVLASKYKKIAIISENAEYSQGLRKALSDLLVAKGVTIVSDETYAANTKDFRTILTKVKSTNPDAIYFNPGTSPAVAGLILNQTRDLGIKSPAYFNFFMGNEETIKIAGKNAEGVIFSDGIGLTSENKNLLEEYKNRFGSSPGNEYEFGAAYDRTFILLSAIKEVGTDPVKVKDYLYNMPEYKGTVGSYRFDQKGDMTLVGYSSYLIKDGKKEAYKP
ncbi:MAG: ABC transporter substrate-binding protein [Patescibacteria group bacterium]